MDAEPLGQILYKGDILRPSGDQFGISRSTACWRGYIGSWEIDDNKLYLVGLEGNPDKESTDLNYVFPNQDRVFACWFSGHIRLGIGKYLGAVHCFYGWIYEKDLVLTLENGVVTHEEEFDNSDVEAVKAKEERWWNMDKRDEHLTEAELMEQRVIYLIEEIRRQYEGTEEALSNFTPNIMKILANKETILEETKALLATSELTEECKEYLMRFQQNSLDINLTEERVAIIEDRFRKTETQMILTKAQKMYPYLTEELAGYTEKELMLLVEKSRKEKDRVSTYRECNREPRDENGWIINRSDFVVDYRHATTEQIIKAKRDKIAQDRAVALHLYIQSKPHAP